MKRPTVKLTQHNPGLSIMSLVSPVSDRPAITDRPVQTFRKHSAEYGAHVKISW